LSYTRLDIKHIKLRDDLVLFPSVRKNAVVLHSSKNKQKG